ncbi:MAG: endopeptidase La [Cytophagales bacterium]|nr:endopeptidase La [Cytophagales bacterium]
MMIEWEVIQPEDRENLKKKTETLSILPIKNTVMFPDVILLVAVSRTRPAQLVKRIFKGDKILGIISQRNPKQVGSANNIYPIGTAAKILKIMERENGKVVIVIQGIQRFRIREMRSEKEPFTAKVDLLKDDFSIPRREEVSMVRALREKTRQVISLSDAIPEHTKGALRNMKNLPLLVHILCVNIPFEVKEKQALLEVEDGVKRSKLLLKKMGEYIQMMDIKEEIHHKVYSDIEQQQRDYFLRQQMKVLQNELGVDGIEKEIEVLQQKAATKKWSSSAQKHFDKEIHKLRRLMPGVPEYSVSMNYLEFLVNLPWETYQERSVDLKRVKKVLDRHHYGIEKVKERVVEYLAVLSLKKDMKAPILCLCAPPGVGKTSLGTSIAKALQRECLRISLGGLHDEAEIRGHRKTYIGAMPGKIIAQIAKGKNSNPVMVLDEIDKVGRDFRGDPASALLEVLDPEQNANFLDNYLEIPYDLSRVLFIATANTLESLHPALLDRLEVIHMSGYTSEEKKQIASKHLLPELRRDHGLTVKDVRIQFDALEGIISDYTRESGVRELKKRLGAVLRHVARAKVEGTDYPKSIRASHLQDILGIPEYEEDAYVKDSVPGLAVGLAWTPYGGDVLYIESLLLDGEGKLILSGRLGKVMQESAQAAFSYVRSQAKALNISPSVFGKNNLHVHVPAGAIPKDGPSAGITLATSIASLFTGRIVKPGLAMTGEITLSGRVLPVGGVKEKLLASRSRGIKEIIFSESNRKHVEELNPKYLRGLTFHYVRRVKEVFGHALV